MCGYYWSRGIYLSCVCIICYLFVSYSLGLPVGAITTFKCCCLYIIITFNTSLLSAKPSQAGSQKYMVEWSSVFAGNNTPRTCGQLGPSRDKSLCSDKYLPNHRLAPNKYCLPRVINQINPMYLLRLTHILSSVHSPRASASVASGKYQYGVFSAAGSTVGNEWVRVSGHRMTVKV